MIKLLEYFNDTQSLPVWVNPNQIALLRRVTTPTGTLTQISLADHAYLRVVESPVEILKLIGAAV